MNAPFATLLAGLLLLTAACTDDGAPADELQVVENPVAATPAKSPPLKRKPAGRVIDVGGRATAVAVEPESRNIAVAVQGDRHEVVYLPLDDLDARPKRRVSPGEVERIESVGPGGLIATVPGADRILYLDRDEPGPGQGAIEGGPASVARLGERTLYALREARAVEVEFQLKPEKTIRGKLASADQVVVAGGNAVVLDRLRSALFEVDVKAGKIGLGLRAGQGATNAVADRYGRVLVVDTRMGALLAFSLDALLLRQRYPVPGRPYGIAYDAKRDLAWVTLTETNEVVGFDVGGAEPKERHRFATVRQPNSVTVDKHTGIVMVASAAGDGIQVIEP